jgi:putative copper resistance protein D
MSHSGWGPNALRDQQVAGAIMWFGGDLLMMLLMIVVGVSWSRAEPDQQGLGGWLEEARRRALLGAGDAHGDNGAHGAGWAGRELVDVAVDVDSDQRALEVYNATLAALHGLPPPTRDTGCLPDVPQSTSHRRRPL